MTEGSTEQKIKEAARKIFLKKGMSGARMQEIADEAGINKALLHYYYRNKEQLFTSVFEEIIRDFMPGLFLILTSELPLEVKVYQLADKYISFLSVHKEMPLFVVNELQRNPERLLKNLQLKEGLDFGVLARQLQTEGEKGTIRLISVEHFLMNMISMLVFPFIGRHLFQGVTRMEDERFLQFLEQRKTEVPKFIMNALRP